MAVSLVLAWCTIFAAAASSQPDRPDPHVIAADSALRAGNLVLAESLYYFAARLHPRDPLVREALGRYIATRGRDQARVASVLLEEARMFGGDPVRIATQLAPLYESLGDWRALLTLPNSPLSAAATRRAAWFSDHPTALTAVDHSDSVTVALVGAPVGDTIGRVSVRVGSKTAMAVLLATSGRVVIGARLAANDVRVFSTSDSSVAVLDSMRLGGLRIAAIPASVAGAPGAITVGVGVFDHLTPRIEFARNRIVFNRPMTGKPMAQLPMFGEGARVRILDGGKWISLGELCLWAARTKHSVEIDAAKGEVRVYQ